MRIAINTRFLLKHKMEGFGWFTYEVCQRMVRDHPEHEFLFYFDRPYDERFIFGPNVTPYIIYPPARHPILYRIWFDASIRTALAKHRPDVFFSPDGFLSLTSRVPQVPVIHDLNFEHHPEQLRARDRFYFRKYFPKFARKAQHIITVSEYSKQDILSTYGVNEDKVTVCYNGASEDFHPLSDEERRETRNRLFKGRPYFIFVGALHPRKNVEGLFRSYDAFRESTDTDTGLLIVGEKLWNHDGSEQAYESMRFKDSVHFSGHLPSEDLVLAVGAARALVFPSFFEGFGIPLVEAMRAGTPILSSDRSSLPEVGGDAALYFDPEDMMAMTRAMIQIDSNKELRAELRAIGLNRGQNFSWDRTANGVWSVLERSITDKA